MKERQSLAVSEPAQIEAVLHVGLQVIVQKEVGQERVWARVVGWRLALEEVARLRGELAITAPQAPGLDRSPALPPSQENR